MNFDIIIPATERNMGTLKVVIEQLQKHLVHRKIIVIGANKLQARAEEFGADFLDEDKVFEGMTLSKIKDSIRHRDSYAIARAGWYFQQFLKLAYTYRCEDEYYLSWDSDTILLNDIGMFDSDGHPFFDVKDEYNRPYFVTMRRLFEGKVRRFSDYSYISEHMLFSSSIVKRMLDDIESNLGLVGGKFFEKILNAVNDIDLLESGFSEFETYGNYATSFAPDLYRIRRLRSERNGDKAFGPYDLGNIDLYGLSQQYDIVSFENRETIIVKHE